MTHSQETPDQSQKAEPLPETREPLKEYQRLSEKIQDAIEKGGLKMGDKLPPERALAETFGVSRNSVREAIRTLSEQGILKSRHGDGTYICGSDLAPLTAALLNAVDTEGKSFDHIMEFRLVIEPSIARIATARHSAEQLHQLKIIVCDQQLKLLHGENDGELDAQFHTLLAAATGNPVFVDIVSHLNELFSHNRADDVRLKRRMEEAINEHLMIISPDEGAMSRAVYFSNVLGVDMGMFYKRRDYSTIVNGKNPIVAHEFLGDSIEGKDVIIIDDMISSGESMLDVARKVKERKANRVFICTTFGLFTEGLSKFDEYYEKGYIEKVVTTDLIYRTPELKSKPYYEAARMGKYLASILDILNHDVSVEKVRSTTSKITQLLERQKNLK